jgi:methyl-accepting chemotaxis protein
MLKNMNVRKRLIGSFVTVAIVAILVGLFTLSRLLAVGEAGNAIYSRGAMPMATMLGLSTNFQQSRIISRDIQLASGLDAKNAGMAKFERLCDSMNAQLKSLEDAASTPTGKDSVKAVAQSIARYHEAIEQAKPLLFAASTNQAQLVASIGGIVKDAQAAMDGFVSYKLGFVQGLAAEQDSIQAAAKTTTVTLLLLNVLIALGFGMWISGLITRPLARVTEALGKISKGEIPEPIEETYWGEFEDLKQDANACARQLKGLVGDIQDLSHSVANEGRFDKRADASKYEGKYRELINGVNGMTATLTGNFQALGRFLENIGKGVIPERSTKELHGDFATMQVNLNCAIDGLKGLVEANQVLQKMAVNDYTVKVEGTYQGIFGEVGTALNAAQGCVKNAIRIMEDLAKGEIEENLAALKKIGRRCENDTLMPAYIQTMDNIQMLIKGFARMTKDIENGNFSVRGDTNILQGDWQKIATCTNEMIESLIKPLDMTREHLGKISQGVVPELITDVYKGEFDEIKNDINACVQGLQGLIEANQVLQKMAQNDLTMKATEGKYPGIFNEVAIAVNTAQLRVQSAIDICKSIAQGDFKEQFEAAKKLGKRSDKDEFLPALISMMNTIDMVTRGTHRLVESMANGNLQDRARGELVQGSWRTLVEGIGSIIDNLTKPLTLSSQYLGKIGQGIIPEAISEEWKGEYNNTRNNINDAISGLQGLVEAERVLKAAAGGDLSDRINGSYQGVYNSTKVSVNGLMDTLSQLLLEDAGMVLREAAGGNLTKFIQHEYKGSFEEVKGSINFLVTSIADIIRQLQQNASTLAGASEELSGVSTQMLAGSEQMVNQSTSVAGATEQMSANIGNMAAAAEQMSANAGEVASSAEQLSQNMNAVAAAVEEMSASIGHIAKNAGEAKNVSSEATTSSKNATQTMTKLGDAAKEIGKVTDVIKRIADQTNLLALNATIEAASAGEAGKGFAVVANEIKELAAQSARAADDIARRIEGVQENTGSAVKMVDEVSEIIGRIESSVNSISMAVEQQTKAAGEISSNVSQASLGSRNIATSITEVAKGANEVSRNSGEAAKGSQDVASNITEVRTAAGETNKGSQQVSCSAGDLARMAGELQGVVKRFQV